MYYSSGRALAYLTLFWTVWTVLRWKGLKLSDRTGNTQHVKSVWIICEICISVFQYKINVYVYAYTSVFAAHVVM